MTDQTREQRASGRSDKHGWVYKLNGGRLRSHLIVVVKSRVVSGTVVGDVLRVIVVVVVSVPELFSTMRKKVHSFPASPTDHLTLPIPRCLPALYV